MESQPQPPEAKSQTPRATISPAPAAQPAPRRYPKPPAFIPRFILLCLRPESWAETARYPLHVTLLPLIFAIILGSLLAAAGQTSRQFARLQAFAAAYDQNYPPMQLSSDGILAVNGELKAPVLVPMFGAQILVDPTGATKPETVDAQRVIALITDKDVVLFNGPFGFTRHPLTALAASPYELIALPAKGQVKPINGHTIGDLVNAKLPFVVLGALAAAAMQALGEALWVALMIFMICPVIILAAATPRPGGAPAARTLIMPRRAACRMAAGLLLPLVVVGALLRAVGRPVADLLTPQGALLFWFLAALALAIWTGLLAKRMYAPQKG